MKVIHLKFAFFLFILGLFIVAGSAAAQSEPASGSDVSEKGASATITPEMMERFERLEAETQRLREEVARLNAEKSEKPKTLIGAETPTGAETPIAVKTPAAAETPALSKISAPESAADSSNTLTKEEADAYIDARVRENAWKVGPMSVTPYGRIWASVLGSTSRTVPQDAVYRVLPDDAYGQSQVSLQARSSRLGLDIGAPDIDAFGGTHMSGKVEIDFRNDTGNAENKGSILLREVYWQMENDDYKLLFGQTKDVISPLNTGMLNYYNVWGAGNIGYRNPQLQFTRYYRLTSCTRMEVTSAIVQMCGSDFASYDSPGSYPTVQGRIGWTIARPQNRYPIQFGFSGHIGEQRYDFPSEKDEIQTWSANLDLSVPLTERCGFRGEAFTGQGLAGIYGGVSQSIDYNPTTHLGSRNSIHSTGGWAEFWWDWTECLHYRVGCGVDDPNNSDLEAASIERNSVIYTNLVYDFTKFLRTGVEYSYWATDYRPGNVGGESGRAHVLEWMWQMDF